jgi:hypothetical protein
MYLENMAYMPFFINPDRIQSIFVSRMEKENDNWHYTIRIDFIDDTFAEIACDQTSYDRNWQTIRKWDKYRYAPPDYFDSGHSEDVPSGAVEPTRVFPPLVHNSGPLDFPVPFADGMAE